MDSEAIIMANRGRRSAEAIKRRQCGIKVQHNTPEAAYLVMQKLIAQQPTDIFAVYKCPFCGQYHVGHKHLQK